MKHEQVNNSGELLQDIKSGGFQIDWNKKRKQALAVGQVLIDEGKIRGDNTLVNRGEKMQNCSEFLTFAEDGYGNKKYLGANRCKDRLCPICNWLDSRKNFARLKSATEEIDIDVNQPISLVLTVPNCSLQELNSALRNLHSAFTRLMNKARVKRVLVGYYRATEITYSPESGMYHPHIHSILFTEENYFDKSQAMYIDFSEWKKMWQKVLRTEDSRNLHVTGIKKNGEYGEEQSLDVALGELSKYIFKPTNNIPNAVLVDYGYQVKGIRFSSSGGIIKRLLENQKEKKMTLDSLEGLDMETLTVSGFVSSNRGYKKYEEYSPVEWEKEMEFRRQMKKNRRRGTNIPRKG